MKRRVGLAVVIFCGLLLAAQQLKPGLLSNDVLKKVVPGTYFFRGQSAPVQLRNSAGFSVPDGKLVLTGLVDTSGYAADVQAKYQGFLITEVKLNIEGSELAPGRVRIWIFKRGKIPGDGRGSQRTVQRCRPDRRQTTAPGATQVCRRPRSVPAVCRQKVG